MKIVIFNIIIGNNDPTARNYSLLYKGDTSVLAPAYDILCTYACPKFKRILSMKTIEKFFVEKFFEKICNELEYSCKDFIKYFYHIAENLYKAIEEEKYFFNEKEELKIVNKILDVVNKRANLANYL